MGHGDQLLLVDAGLQLPDAIFRGGESAGGLERFARVAFAQLAGTALRRAVRRERKREGERERERIGLKRFALVAWFFWLVSELIKLGCSAKRWLGVSGLLI